MNGMYHNAIFVTSPEKLPPGEHWAIIEFGSITVPGDQRSIEAPGHGYPEHSETTVDYRAYLTRVDLDAELQERATRRAYKTFRVIHVAAQLVARPSFVLEERK